MSRSLRSKTKTFRHRWCLLRNFFRQRSLEDIPRFVPKGRPAYILADHLWIQSFWIKRQFLRASVRQFGSSLKQIRSRPYFSKQNHWIAKIVDSNCTLDTENEVSGKWLENDVKQQVKDYIKCWREWAKLNLVNFKINNHSKISNYSVVQSDVNFADHIFTIGFQHVVNQSADFVLVVLSKRAFWLAFPLTFLVNMANVVSWQRRGYHRQSSESLKVS